MNTACKVNFSIQFTYYYTVFIIFWYFLDKIHTSQIWCFIAIFWSYHPNFGNFIAQISIIYQKFVWNYQVKAKIPYLKRIVLGANWFSVEFKILLDCEEWVSYSQHFIHIIALRYLDTNISTILLSYWSFLIILGVCCHLFRKLLEFRRI